MRINSLSLTNFRKHGMVDLDFPIDSQIILISGKNGVGKTTILEAILYSLYGEGRHGKKNLDTIVKRGKEFEGMTVELLFTIKDHTYKIIRRRENKVSTAKLYLNDNILVEGSNEVSQFIASLVGLDSTGFKLAIMAQQKDVDGFSTLTSSERATTISRLLRLDILNKAKDLAGSLFRKERDISKELQILNSHNEAEAEFEDINIISNDITLLNSNIAKLELEVNLNGNVKSLYSEYVFNIKSLKDKILEKKTNITNLENKLISISLPDYEEIEDYDIEELENEIVDLEKKIAIAEENNLKFKEKLKLDIEIREINSYIAEKQSIIENLKSLIFLYDPKYSDSLLIEKNSLKTEIESLMDKKRSLQDEQLLFESIRDSLNNNICSTCGQEITEEYREVKFEEISNNISEVQISISKLDASLKVKDSLYRSIEDELTSVNKKIEQNQPLHDKINFYQSELNSSKLKLSHIEESVSKLPNKVIETDELYVSRTSILSRISTIKRGIENKHIYQTLSNEISRLNSEISTEDSILSRLDAQLIELENDDSLTKKYNNFILNENELIKLRSVLSDQKIKYATLVEKDKHKKEIENIYATRKEKELEHQNNALLYSDAAKVISLVSEMLSQQIRPLIESHMSNLLSLMSNGRFSKVTLTDEYEILVFDDNNFRPISELSGGEQDLTSLSLRLALSQILSLNNSQVGSAFLILDECFASQDAERRDSLLSSLRNLKTIYPQIFIVSHIEQIEDYVDKVISIELNDDRNDTEVTYV